MHSLSIKIDNQVYNIEIDEPARNGAPYCVRVNGEPLRVSLPISQSEKDHWVVVDDRLYEVLSDPNLRWIFSGNQAHEIEVHESKLQQPLPERRDHKVKAPIPGRISQVLVKAGEDVCQGQTVIVLEAMKMYNELKAPCCGVVQAVNVEVGMNVKKGEILIEIGS
jgi:biotin carboxyl carrier protein